jgi:hypothetical protein
MSYDYGFRKGGKKGASLFFSDEKGAKTKKPKTKKKAKIENETEGGKFKGIRHRKLRFFAA